MSYRQLKCPKCKRTFGVNIYSATQRTVATPAPVNRWWHTCRYSDSYGIADCGTVRRNNCGPILALWEPLNV